MTENKDNLAQYERNERYLGEQLFIRIPTIKEFDFTTGRICYDSVVTTTEDKKIIVEIKVRKFKREKYNTYILQVDKLQNLIKRAQKLNLDQIRYVNFFECDDPSQVEFIIFDLTPRIKAWQKHPPKVETIPMNSETWKSTEYKVYKQVIMLTYDPKIDSKGDFSLN